MDHKGEARAALWVERGTIEVLPVARLMPGPGEILIGVGACGICGSDLHRYRAEMPRATGFGPGHEVVGEVLALGAGVSGPKPGTRVAVEPYFSCGECRHCLRGRGYLCRRRRMLGFGAPGGMGDLTLAQAGRVYPLPDDLPWRTAALTEPLAIVLHGLRRAGLIPSRYEGAGNAMEGARAAAIQAQPVRERRRSGSAAKARRKASARAILASRSG
jgi:threonine dehydrogenase-like Zn-dependent dehydrogenase